VIHTGTLTENNKLWPPNIQIQINSTKLGDFHALFRSVLWSHRLLLKRINCLVYLPTT